MEEHVTIDRFWYFSYSAENATAGVALGNLSFQYNNAFPPKGWVHQKIASATNGQYVAGDITLLDWQEFKSPADYASFVSE